jgi:hypothetical protein
MVGNVILPFQNIPIYRYIGILYQYTGIITHKLYRRHRALQISEPVFVPCSSLGFSLVTHEQAMSREDTSSQQGGHSLANVDTATPGEHGDEAIMPLPHTSAATQEISRRARAVDMQ